MQRSLVLLLALSFLLSGCGTNPTDVESTRETVLQYLGGDVGTAGPFGRGGIKELYVLSPQDQRAATALIKSGAQAFLVYGGSPGTPDANIRGVTRIVLVQRGRVVADYHSVPNHPPAPPASAPAQ